MVAPSLDVIGPMAASLDGIALGMQLLEPGFRETSWTSGPIGRVRVPTTGPVDAALDAVVGRLGVEVVDIDGSGWLDAWRASMTVLDREATEHCRTLLEQADALDPVVADRLRRSAARSAEEHGAALVALDAWRAELDAYFSECGVLALPTIADVPPLLEQYRSSRLTAFTASVNGAGVPALSMPVGVGDPVPASLMLVARHGGEEQLLAVARAIEAS
jgi:Asp-tRNA(Asn)/Glu-tRNA(Gln) amidotransferase A subunit family amidase